MHRPTEIPSSTHEIRSSSNASVSLKLVESGGVSVAFNDTQNVPHNDTAVFLERFPSEWLIAGGVSSLVLLVMTTAFLYMMCRCMMRRRKRENQLASITPKPSDQWLAGVRASQPIEFVVPTTILVSANSEDSVSETDCSSGGTKYLPILMERRRRRRRRSDQIHPDDLQRGLYVGIAAASKRDSFVGDLGRLGFSLHYSLSHRQLTVKMIGADNLPCHSLRTTANPCVKVVLLPDRSVKFVTKVQKDTTCPRFNESFVFNVRWDELPLKRLKMSVWDYDRFSRKCLVGQVVYRLSSALSVDAAPEEIWVPLRRDSQVSSGFEGGEVLLSLSYDPDAATLTLEVVKVRNPIVRPDKDTSVYVKVRLYVRRKLLRTKKTPSKRKVPEVEFGIPFSIRVPQSALQEVDLLVVLCEKGTLGSKQVLGRTQAGANCLCDQGRQHWQDMLGSPKSTCAQWHSLCA